MILLIDNYDSFSYNLYQLIGEIDQHIKVVRNDEITIEEIKKLKPDRIILSPGPGRPEDEMCIRDSYSRWEIKGGQRINALSYTIDNWNES